MNHKATIMRAVIFLAMAFFIVSNGVWAQSCGTAKGSAAKGSACANEQAGICPETGKPCDQAGCPHDCPELKKASLDCQALKNIQAAAQSGDFSKVSACQVSRETLKKLTMASKDFNVHSKELIFEAVEGRSDFSKVSGCKVTRAEIRKALAGYALRKQGVDESALGEIESAVSSGYFTKVSACPVSRETLKKVIGAKSNFNSECRSNLLTAMEKGDFSKVAACQATKKELKQALEEFREKSIQTALQE